MARRGPKTLRPIVQNLHWATLILIVAYLAEVVPGWILLAHALPWLLISGIWGLRAGRSPALPGTLGTLALAGHWGLLGLYGVAAGFAAFGLDAAEPLLFATIAVAALHGTFNLWRASVLGDGALRRMLPKAFH